jgi:hypothetical protein
MITLRFIIIKKKKISRKLENEEYKDPMVSHQKNGFKNEKTIQVGYYLPNEIYPYLTSITIIFDNKQYLKLKDIKRIIHKKFDSTFSYLFTELLEPENFESYSIFSNDESYVPFYDDKTKTKIICFLI